MTLFRTHRVLVGVLLLPMFLGALVVWSLGDRAEKVDAVPAAVVNLDEPVLKKGQPPVAAGRLLAAGLTSPTDDRDVTLDWQLTDADDAASGLSDGDYYAVVTIPRSFSRTIAGAVQGGDPERASIRVTSDDASSPLVARISDQVARVSAKRLGERVTTTYLDQVFSRTGELAGSLGKAADGADRLAKGTTRLGSGSTDLADGLDRLAGGADRVSGGADRLASGTERLGAGVDRLAGANRRLAAGLGVLADRTDPLPGQTDRLADGARQVAQGVGPYTKLLKGWAQACANPLIAANAAQLCVATERAVGPGGRNADRLAAGSRQVADGTRQLADGMPRLAGGIDRAAGGASRLADGTRRLANGTDRLSSGARDLADGATTLAGGAREASSGADRLATGTSRLGDGSTRLADGLQKGAQQVPTYDDQERRDLADVIASPVAASTDRVGEVADGPTQLAPGLIAFALWLGAFVTSLVRPALPARLLRRPLAATDVARGGLRPALLIGAVQAILLYVVLLGLGADLGAPWPVLPVMLLASAAFAALHQTLTAVLGNRRGWLASIALAALQAVALGGILPLETAPGPLPVLNAVLPMTATADALVAAVLNGPGSVLGGVAVLLAWGAVAFGATVLAARRAQQVGLDDLHAALAAERPRVGSGHD